MNGMCKRRILAVVLMVVMAVVLVITLPVSAQVVLAVLDLGADGGGAAVNPGTQRVYVAVTGNLNVYTAQTHTLLATIPLPQNYSPCNDVAVNGATNRVYAVGLRTYVVDAVNNTVLLNLDKQGDEVAVNPATNRVYIADWSFYPYTEPSVVHVLDGASQTWLPDIVLGSASSLEYIHLAVDPAANRVYITFSGDDDLRVLDGTSHIEIARTHLENIGNVAVNPGTNRLYVGKDYSDVAVLDASTYAQVGTISSIGRQLRLNRLTNRLYGVWAGSPGYVLRIADLHTNSQVGYVYLDGNLESYGIAEDLGKLFAVHASSPAGWGQKMTVVQDASPSNPAPAPSPPAVIATAQLPEDGDGIGVNSATNRVYVGVDGGLAVLDAVDLTSLGYVNLSSDTYTPPIYDVGVDANRNRIYAVSVGQTYVVNGANNQVIGALGGGDEIAVNPSNGRVYIADDAVWRGDPDRLKIYNGETLAHIRTINLGVSDYFQSGHVAANPTTGYAYCTYSLDDDLRVISPMTDDVVQTIDYASVGTVAVNPTTNRVYVWIARGGQSGALALDGHSHVELGMIQGASGRLATNPQTNRLYGYTGYTLFQSYDGASGSLASRVFLDGNIRDYTVHPGLSRLYVTHADYPAGWAKKVSVIQDTTELPTPTPRPTSTPTRTPTATPTPRTSRTPTPTPTPTEGAGSLITYLPVILKGTP